MPEPSLTPEFAAECALHAGRSRRIGRHDWVLNRNAPFPVYIDANPNGFRIDGDHTRIIRGNTRFTADGGMGFIARGVGTRSREALVCFRGSDTANNKLDDLLLTDANCAMHLSKKGHLVHAGFDHIARTCYQQLKTELAPDGRLGDVDVVHFVGHSMGGALALLAAEAHYSRGRCFHVHTFGAPRCGDVIFAKYMERNMDQINRYYYHDDPVAHIPYFPYWHAKGTSLGRFTGAHVSGRSHGAYFYRQLTPTEGYEASIYSQKWGTLSAACEELSGKRFGPVRAFCGWASYKFGVLLRIILKALGFATFFIGATVADGIAAALHNGYKLGGKIGGFVSSIVRRCIRILWKLFPGEPDPTGRNELRMRNYTVGQQLTFIFRPLLEKMFRMQTNEARLALAEAT